MKCISYASVERVGAPMKYRSSNACCVQSDLVFYVQPKVCVKSGSLAKDGGTCYCVPVTASPTERCYSAAIMGQGV